MLKSHHSIIVTAIAYIRSFIIPTHKILNDVLFVIVWDPAVSELSQSYGHCSLYDHRSP